jgi:transposase-like protein
MIDFKNNLLKLVKLFHSIKNESLQWQQSNQDKQLKLKQARTLAEKELETELKNRSLELAHHIRLLKTKHETELSMLKTKCKQDINDYKDYLNSLDQLKRSLQSSYSHLPDAVAFTIHHHAKYLLHMMWETDDFEQKMLHEMKLITFMTTIHEDARLYLEGQTNEHLPENTLKLIHKSQLTKTR